MAKSLQQRVDDAFQFTDVNDADQVRCDAIEYCKSLRETWALVSQSLNRSVLIMVVAAVIFVFLRVDKSAKISTSGLQVSNLTVVQAALPVVVAYLYLEIILLMRRYIDTQDLCRLTMEKIYPRVVDNDLNIWLAPPSRALFSPGSGYLITGGGGGTRLDSLLVFSVLGTGMAFILVGPLFFEGYAFWVLFQQGDYFAWVCGMLAVTIGLLTASLLAMLSNIRVARDIPVADVP